MADSSRQATGVSERLSTRSYVAAKAFVMLGSSYRVGDPVIVSQLSEAKVSQLLDQRYIRPASA